METGAFSHASRLPRLKAGVAPQDDGGVWLIMQRLAIAAIAVLLLFVPHPASADTYPSRAITIVVPYPAGGSVDGVARFLADELAERLGVGVVVENRAGGAGGIVGAATVARAAPDGYTLMLTASIHVVTPFLFKNVPYDVVKDFSPISLVASGPLIVSTSKTTPARTLAEFFSLVRKEPDKFTFATSSRGSAGHLTVELLKRQAGLDTLVVAYRGAGPALIDVIGGRVQLIADPFLSSLPHVRAGELRALAVTSLQRVALAPEIPTIAESGMQPFERPLGAEGAAARYPRRARVGRARLGVRAEIQGAPQPARLRADRHLGRGVQGLYRRRDREERQDRARRRHHGRVTEPEGSGGRYAQFSARTPGIRANSRILLVTIISPSARACAPISISCGPTGVPARSSSARICP